MTSAEITGRPRGVVIVGRMYQTIAVILLLSMPAVMLGDMIDNMRSWTASVPIVVLLGTAGILLLVVAHGLLTLRYWALYGAIGLGTVVTAWYVYKMAVDPRLSRVAAATMILLATVPVGYLLRPAIRRVFAHRREDWS